MAWLPNTAMTPTEVVLRSTAVAAALLGLLGALRVWQVSRSPDPEVVRKFFHMGGGGIALALPWLFDALLPVLVLGAGMFVLFALLRGVPALRGGIGQVLLAVERDTVGEFCFVAALAVLFWAAMGERLIYCVCVMVLAVADTVAALVGTTWGRHRIETSGGHKTVEGSIAFFVSAFLCAYLPFSLFSALPQQNCWLIAANVALMTMIAEAAAWRGFDNLVVPLFALVLLRIFGPMDARQLSSHLTALIVVGAVAFFWRRHTSLADDGLSFAALGGYAVWALADWRWALAPIILFLTYGSTAQDHPRIVPHKFHVPVVAANFAAGFLWLVLTFRDGEGHGYLLPFVAAFAANLSAIALVRHKVETPAASSGRAVAVSTLKGSIVVVPTLIAADGLGAVTLLHGLACMGAVFVSTAVFFALQPRLSSFPVDAARWLRQVVITAGASALLLTLPATG